jgi:hypothetical protein
MGAAVVFNAPSATLTNSDPLKLLIVVDMSFTYHDWQHI